MRYRQQFEWKEFIKRLAVLAIPVALQNLLSTTASMVDTMMIGPLGETSLGAIGLCSQFSSLMFSGYWGFIGGGMLFFAQYWGAKDDRGIERSFGLLLTCVMTVVTIFASGAIFAPEIVMKLYTDKVAIQQAGVPYLRIVGIAYIFQGIAVAVSALLRSTEQVKIPLYASITSALTNILFNWILIYGHFGLPAMGIIGAAIATVLAGIVNVAVMYVLAYKAGYRYPFAFKNHFKWTKADVKTFLKKCFPIICNGVLMGVAAMLINVTLGRQPEPIIAALAVFRTLEGIIVGFFTGFSNATSILVGKCVGAGDLRLAYERAKRLVYMCSGVILLACILVISLHTPILTLMGLSGESFEAGTRFLVIYLIVAVIRMGNWIQNDVFRTAGDATFGTMLEIIFMYAMLLPAVLISGFVFEAPYWVLFICCYIDEPIRYIMQQVHLYRGKWIKPVTEAGIEALPEFMAGIKRVKKA